MALGLIKGIWLLPHAVAVVRTERRRRLALNSVESERLDRIRNPSKYLGR